MKRMDRVYVLHIMLICLFLNVYSGLVTADDATMNTTTSPATTTQAPETTAVKTTTTSTTTTTTPLPTSTSTTMKPTTTTTQPPAITTEEAATTTTTTAAATTTTTKITTAQSATSLAPPTDTTAATDSKVSTTISTNNLTNATSTISSTTTLSTAASTPIPSTKSTTQNSTPTTSSTTTSTTTTTKAPTTTAGNNSVTSQTIPPETSTLSTLQSSPVTTTLSTVTANGTTATLSSSSPTTLSTSPVTSASSVASNGTQSTLTTTSLEQTTAGSSSNVPTTTLPPTTSNESTTVKQENQTTTTSTENGTSSSTEQTTSSTTTGITSSTTSQSTSQQTTSNILSSTQSVQTTTADPCDSLVCANNGTCLANSTATCSCVLGYTGEKCETNINDCVGEKCFNNGTCIDQVNNFTCTCTTGWKGHDCSKNINECEEKTHKCNRNANCTDTEGGYNCTCWEGFTGNGYMCVDINECVSNSTVCFNNATCVNTPGDHRCVCAPGWTGDTCFVDIDECKVASACASNSNCTNTNGSYTCKCKDGYRGDGYHKCIEEVLIVVDNVGHTESGDDEIFGPYHVNKSLSLFGRMYNKFYVSINGYITLGNVINETYPPATSSGWDRFEVPIIAPLWADIEIHGTNSGVEITNELSGKDLENIAKHLQVNSLRTGLVVTWKRAVPYPYTQNANFEAADFQVVIGATESNTYVMFNYDQEIFKWRAFSDRIVAAGYYFNDKNKLMTLDSNNFTSANMMNYDSSIKGRWIFNATSSSTEWKAKLACLAAVNTLETNVESSEPCPCSEAQALRDTRFKSEGKKTIKGIKVQQYVPRFKQPNERRQLCHYSSQYGSLIKGYPGGGYLETVNVTNAYKLCCNNSENISCNVFYQTSPSDNCSSYLPPTWSLSWGDPHFTTLDGKNYTFNGRGEYTLLSLDDASQSVKVQVRTEHIGDRKSATIFTGLAAQEVGKTKIELLLMNRTLKTANLYINNVLNTTFSSSKNLNLDFDDGSITSSNATISIMFKSGLTIRVAVSDVLNIVTSVPKDEPFKGKTSGLLGNNNGISTDDFIKKNGTVLPAGSNEETLYSFGQSWMLTKNESLFGYYNSSTNGRNFTFFNDPAKAKPVTFIADADNFTDILITNCYKTHGLNLTHCKGNKACIVDTIGSCQKDFGEMSLDTEENAIKEKEIIDNMPPDLEIPNELYVGYSKNTSVELTFKQQSVVQVTCKTNIESKSYKCDNTMFSWNVSQSLRNSMVDLTIMAKDSLNAYSEYQPNIYYCGCEKADQCDYSLIQIDGPNDNFFRARCVCPETQNGTYCEKRVNICDRNPCFENVTCNSTLDNPCGPCPAGLTGDGVKCYDIDECRTNQSNCGQLCNNTIGGYTCSCRKGYEVDGNTCKDIDECSSNPPYCDSHNNTYCVNTIGSADCLCMPGYTENNHGQCVNVKEKHSYGGVLVFEATPSVTKEDLKKPMIDYLTSIFSTSGSVSTPGSVYFVELVSFIFLPSSRKKRDTTSFNKYEMDYIVHMNQSVPTENLTASLDNTFNNLGQENGFVSPKIPGLNAVVKISTKDSKIFSDKDGGICNMPGSVTCDDISTKCVSANGDYSCICREGFSGWANPYTSCKDIDECGPKPSTVCIGGNCTNYPGSYLCRCEPGFRYEKPNCVDMCDSNPCQNGGQCIHGNTEGMYLCKCDDKWTGPNCENENSEAEKLKIIAIAVGASVGGVCLLLLCGLCGMYRRYRNRYSGYRRRPLSSMDFDSSFGMAGTNIRTKDFPIDDDTDTAFSIPRPKYNENEYDMLKTNASSLNETSVKDTGKIEEQESQIPKVTKETSAYGNDNPSFLHSENMEAARRSSKRSSKNAYEYF